MTRKTQILSAIIALLFLSACVDVSPTESAASDEEQAMLQAAGDVGRSDLLDLLQGRWFNIKDASASLEFQDNRIYHLNNDEVEREGTLIIDSNCSIDDCGPGNLQDGWCFMETSETANQCYVVLGCTSQELKLAPIGSESAPFVYQRP